MKWNRKGQELDQKAKYIVESFLKRKQVYVFGAGLRGTELHSILKYYGIFGGFIDNDYNKQANGYEGARVYSLEEYQNQKSKSWIIIAASDIHSYEIERQLENAGYQKKEDYYYYEEFIKDIFPILSFYHFRKLFVFLAQISVTERCTLHCRKCAHACHNVGITTKDMTLDMAKKSADSFFQYVDIINEFVLIGGEPFLYGELEELVDYIGERYREKILRFSITTNGTILPSDKMLELCKKYRVTIRVSDYSDTLPKLASRYKLFYERTNKLDVIVWKTRKQDCWFDYGYEEIDRGEDISLLKKTFDRCRTDCREVRGSRYYYCVMARSVSENMNWGIGTDDYLELDGLQDKKIFFEYQQGFSDKGYLDLCRHCRGAEAPMFLIPAAEQE